MGRCSDRVGRCPAVVGRGRAVVGRGIALVGRCRDGGRRWRKRGPTCNAGKRVASSKSLTREQQDRVRTGLLRLVERAGSQKKAASEIGVTQQTVNACASRVNEPGVTLAHRVAKALGHRFEELVDGAPAYRFATYKDLPGWEQAAIDVVAAGAHHRGVVRRAGELTISFLPARVDARLVLDVCALWLSHAPLPDRMAVETEGREGTMRDPSSGPVWPAPCWSRPRRCPLPRVRPRRRRHPRPRRASPSACRAGA